MVLPFGSKLFRTSRDVGFDQPAEMIFAVLSLFCCRISTNWHKWKGRRFSCDPFTGNGGGI